jgi:membrane protein
MLASVGRFIRKVNDDRATMLAALLAWSMLNTLLPLALCVMAFAGLVLQDPAQLAAVEDAIVRLLPAQVAPAVQAALEAASTDAGAVGLIGLGLLLWSGSSFFTTMEFVFALAYRIPQRSFVAQRVVSLFTLLGFASLLVLASLTSSIAVLSALVMLGAFQLLYTVLPNRAQRWQSALPGALLASVAFSLVLRLFPLYVSLFGSGFSVYLAFGTVLLFTLWLYVVGMVIVGGAEINAFLESERGYRLRP